MQRTRDEIATDDFIDEAHLARLAGIDRLGVEDHAQRIVEADEPGQPLRATGRGNHAEGDFRQHELCRGWRNAVVTGESQLETATDRGAVHGRDHGNLEALEPGPERPVFRLFWRAGKL